MQLTVLGRLTADGGELELGPRDRVVLQMLLLHLGSATSAAQLADALWPGTPPASWRKVVQGCVVRLRRVLGSGIIQTTPHGYRLEVPGEDLDAVRFERLVGRGRELLALGDAERAAHAIAEAHALWQGKPYSELVDCEDAVIEAERLMELRREAEELTIEAALRAGRHREVLADAHAATAREPLREQRWAMLARAEYQSGRQTQALQTLQRARGVLISEAGLDPGPQLVELEAAILRQDTSLTVDEAEVQTATTCPYRGLVPYGIDDSESFFGRERVVRECRRMLAEQGVLAVVGPSGSGKSSVVRAGVAAGLRREGQRVMITTPGERPMDIVGTAARDHVQVLIIDQLEEVLLGEGTTEPADFFDALTDFAAHTPVAIALRADRLGEVSTHPGLAAMIQRGLHLLGPMDGSDLRAAIETPARQAGFLLEAGLVDLLVLEVEGEPGALPLLSHALRRTWERREGRVLTVSGYHETGGLRGAVAQSAESLYGSLDDDRQLVVQDLFLRMVSPNPTGDPVRSPVPHRLVAGDVQHQQVIRLLVDSRLVTSDGDSLELAHEALVRAWPRLQTWLDDDVEGQRILRHLTLAADSWQSMGRPTSELYRGLRLQTALNWRARTRPALTPAETAFLDAGHAAAQDEAADAAERVRRQTVLNRRLRVLLGVAGVFLLLAVAAGVQAARSGQQALSDAAAAQAARGNALAVTALNTLAEDRSLALLLAVEAHRTTDDPVARRALSTALFAPALSRTSIQTEASDHMALAVDRAGSLAVAKRADGALDVIDLGTRTVRHSALPGPVSPVEGLAVDPTGALAATAGVPSGGAAVLVYDLDTGEEVFSFAGEEGHYHWVAFSVDGRDLAVADGMGTVRVFRTAGWAQRAVLDTGIGRPSSALRYADNGSTIFLATMDPEEAEPATLHALDVSTGAVSTAVLASGQPLVSSIVHLPGSDQIVVASDALERYDADTLEPIGEPFGPTGVTGLVSLAASPDGSLAAGSPVELHVYGDADAAQSSTPAMFTQGFPGVAFVDGGATLITADIGGPVSTWNVEPIGDLGTPLQPEGPGLVSLSPDGSILGVWGEGRGVQLLDRTTHAHRGALEIDPDASLTGIDFAEDGSRLVTLTCPRGVDPCPATLEVWDVSTRQRVAGPVAAGDVWAFLENGVAFTGDGTGVVTAGADGVVHLWNAATLEPQLLRRPLVLAEQTTLPSQQVWMLAAAQVDDRSLVAAHDELGQTVVWDLTGGEVSVIGTLENALRVAFSPDGRLVTSSGRGAFVLRDPFTLKPVSPVFPASVPPTSYHFSDTGIMSSSGSFGTELWHVATARRLSGVLPAFRSALSPDGLTLYLGAGPVGDVVRSLSLDPDTLAEEACRRAGRNLTSAEWSTVMGDEQPYRATCPDWLPS
jgi:DNA-binding SARP family transcriptional activator/WD40 repeat protein/energy-coupling factor transporter ATP-binding protein EcfA2